MRVFVFGLGYSSLATVRAIHRDIDPTIAVAGTVRTEDRAGALADSAIRVHLFDGETPGAALAGDLAEATHVIASIPPDEHGEPVLRQHRASLDAAKTLEWIGYFSTVGVYGDFAGAWIDETAPCHPINPRSRHRLIAEQQWRDYAAQRGVPLAILRLAGIYGPGRSSLDKLRDGTARRVVKPGQVFNRIHVADIGRITELAAARKLAGTFNVADDEPAPPQDLVMFAAARLGIEPPPEIAFDAAEMSPMARSFYADNKRIANTAIKAALGIALIYPNYREGLAAILESDTK